MGEIIVRLVRFLYITVLYLMQSLPPLRTLTLRIHDGWEPFSCNQLNDILVIELYLWLSRPRFQKL